MHFSKIAAVLSFAAIAVAAPAPVAVSDATLMTRTEPAPNACKEGNKYYNYADKPGCAPENSYKCSTTALIAVANCNNVLNNVNVLVFVTDLIDVVLYLL